MSYIFVSENFVKTYIFGSSFLLVQAYIFGFSLGWKLIFLDKFSVQQRWIEWRDFKWTVFKAMLTACCLPYRNVEHWKIVLFIFLGIFCLRLLPKIIFLGSTVKRSNTPPYLSSVSTDPLGLLENTTSLVPFSHFPYFKASNLERNRC